MFGLDLITSYYAVTIGASLFNATLGGYQAYAASGERTKADNDRNANRKQRDTERREAEKIRNFDKLKLAIRESRQSAVHGVERAKIAATQGSYLAAAKYLKSAICEWKAHNLSARLSSINENNSSRDTLADMYFFLGLMYYKNQDLDEAISALETSFSLDRYALSTSVMLGIIYFQKKQYRESRKYFEHIRNNINLHHPLPNLFIASFDHDETGVRTYLDDFFGGPHEQYLDSDFMPFICLIYGKLLSIYNPHEGMKYFNRGIVIINEAGTQSISQHREVLALLHIHRAVGFDALAERGSINDPRIRRYYSEFYTLPEYDGVYDSCHDGDVDSQILIKMGDTNLINIVSQAMNDTDERTQACLANHVMYELSKGDFFIKRNRHSQSILPSHERLSIEFSENTEARIAFTDRDNADLFVVSDDAEYHDSAKLLIQEYEKIRYRIIKARATLRNTRLLHPNDQSQITAATVEVTNAQRQIFSFACTVAVKQYYLNHHLNDQGISAWLQALERPELPGLLDLLCRYTQTNLFVYIVDADQTKQLKLVRSVSASPSRDENKSWHMLWVKLDDIPQYHILTHIHTTSDIYKRLALQACQMANKLNPEIPQSIDCLAYLANKGVVSAQIRLAEWHSNQQQHNHALVLYSKAMLVGGRKISTRAQVVVNEMININEICDELRRCFRQSRFYNDRFPSDISRLLGVDNSRSQINFCRKFSHAMRNNQTPLNLSPALKAQITRRQNQLLRECRDIIKDVSPEQKNRLREFAFELLKWNGAELALNCLEQFNDPESMLDLAVITFCLPNKSNQVTPAKFIKSFYSKRADFMLVLTGIDRSLLFASAVVTSLIHNIPSGLAMTLCWFLLTLALNKLLLRLLTYHGKIDILTWEAEDNRNKFLSILSTTIFMLNTVIMNNEWGSFRRVLTALMTFSFFLSVGYAKSLYVADVLKNGRCPMHNHANQDICITSKIIDKKKLLKEMEDTDKNVTALSGFFRWWNKPQKPSTDLDYAVRQLEKLPRNYHEPIASHIKFYAEVHQSEVATRMLQHEAMRQLLPEEDNMNRDGRLLS